MPGAGLYTYTPGKYWNYFHGTVSHNTVVVDDKSQAEGNGVAGPLFSKDGVTYQTAENTLYVGVTDRRLVMMLDTNHLLVVDRLSSGTVHTYQQMFHLFPGAKLLQFGLTMSGVGGTPWRAVTIRQLLRKNMTAQVTINNRGAKPAGLCSQKFGVLLPCYQISYTVRGRDATYLTLITIGPEKKDFDVKVAAGGSRLTLTDAGRVLRLSFAETTAIRSADRSH